MGGGYDVRKAGGKGKQARARAHLLAIRGGVVWPQPAGRGLVLHNVLQEVLSLRREPGLAGKQVRQGD